MSILEIFIRFFKNKLNSKKEVNIDSSEIDLSKWEYICQTDDINKRTLILEMSETKTDLDAKLLAGALAYSNEETRKKWIKAAEEIWPSFAVNLIVSLKQLNNSISELQSDRLKAYLVNNFAPFEKWTNKDDYDLQKFIKK